MIARNTLTIVLFIAAAAPSRADFNVDFEDKTLATPNSFYNGSDSAGGFSSRGAFFNNAFNNTFGSWSGWSYSNVNDPTTKGFGNQYAAITGTGIGGSGNYGVGFIGRPNGSFINLPSGSAPVSLFATNTTYTYLSMLEGDQFAKKFVAGDFLTLKISGFSALNATGTKIGEVDFDLARYVSNSDTPVHDWTLIGLGSLATAQSLAFDIASSDVGSFGINTPTYFAIDNLRLTGSVVPEPSSLLLLAVGLLAIRSIRKSAK